MQGDRVGWLIVQAAATGAIDFREADPFDRHWNLKVKLILEHLQHQLYMQSAQLSFQEYLGILPLVEPQQRGEIIESATAWREEAVRHLLPWVAATAQDKKRTIQRLRAQYIERYGDPESEENARKVDALIAKWEQDAQKARQG